MISEILATLLGKGNSGELLAVSHYLDLREAFNIAVGIAAPVLAMLLARYIGRQVRDAYLYCKYNGIPTTVRCIYGELGWQARASFGWLCICVSETVRCWLVWEVIHYFPPSEATYAMHIIPLTLSLVLMTIGLTCVIRELTPDSVVCWFKKHCPRYPTLGKHMLWVPTLLVIVILLVLNFTVVDRRIDSTKEYLGREQGAIRGSDN